MIYMQGKSARHMMDVDDVDTFVVNAKAGETALVREQLKPICNKTGLMIHSFADLRQRLDNLMTGVIASLWGLLAMGFVVGSFGIANTLTMNVLEQTRELALLRVVAMTRRQVRKTILAQAVIIGLIGLGAWRGRRGHRILCDQPVHGSHAGLLGQFRPASLTAGHAVLRLAWPLLSPPRGFPPNAPHGLTC